MNNMLIDQTDFAKGNYRNSNNTKYLIFFVFVKGRLFTKLMNQSLMFVFVSNVKTAFCVL